jgi:hypothetical protein
LHISGTHIPKTPQCFGTSLLKVPLTATWVEVDVDDLGSNLCVLLQLLEVIRVVRKRDSEREQIRSLQLALKDAESKGQTQVQRPTVLQQEVLETKKIFKKKSEEISRMGEKEQEKHLSYVDELERRQANEDEVAGQEK